MDNGEIFAILGIDETKNKQLIKDAYRQKLAVTNPEDDEAGFMRLREAYEAAMSLADTEEDNTPSGLWLRDVKEVYASLPSRLDEWAWDELLEDEACTDAGIYNDSREKLLGFMIEGNTYLPDAVYDKIVKTFRIEEDIEELSEKFPRGFLEFLLRHGNGVKIELMETEDGAKADALCDLWFDFKNASAEKRDEAIKSCIEKYEQSDVVMPYFSADLANMAAIDGDREKALGHLAKVEYCIERDSYIAAACASAYAELDMLDRAEAVCEILDKKFSGNINARRVRARIAEKSGDYVKAKKIYEDVYGTYADEKIFEKIKQVNEKLIENAAPVTVHDKTELAWCYYQNGRDKEMEKLITSYEPEDKQDFESYYHLYALMLLQKEDYKSSYEYIKKWIAELKDTELEIEDKTRKRRTVISSLLAARCCKELAAEGQEEMWDKALEYASDETVCEDRNLMISLRIEKSLVYSRMKDYEKSNEVCSSIINDNRDVVPAYLIRQENNFLLHDARAVLDEYYGLLQMYPDIDTPSLYAYAAHIFLIFDRYDDAFDILKTADDNGAKSDYIEFVRACCLRYTAKCEDDTLKALEMLEDIEDREVFEGFGINTKRELYEEMCYANMDLEIWREAIRYIDMAIAMMPKNEDYYSTKLNIYIKSNDRAGFDSCIKEVREALGGTPLTYYSQARFCEGSNRKKAIGLYRQALKMQDDYRDTLARLTRLYHNEFLEDMTELNFKSALEYATKNVECRKTAKSYIDRGVLYLNNGMAQEAEMDFEQAVKENEDDITAYEWLGDALRVQEKHHNAVKYYKTAYEMPTYSDNYHPSKDYALGCEALGDFDEAERVLREMTEKYPDEIYVWSALGKLLNHANKEDAALEAFKKYRELLGREYEENKKDSALWDRYATNDEYVLDVLYVLGRKDEAHELVQAALDMLGDHPRALLNAAKYYCYFEGSKRKTYSHLNKAFKRIEIKKYGCGYMHTTLCRARVDFMYALGDWTGLAKKRLIGDKLDVKAAYRDKRYRKSELYNLAIYYYHLGDKKQAFKYFADMQEGANCIHCPYNECIESKLGIALMLAQKGNTDKALEIFEELYNINFDNHQLDKLKENIKEKEKK